MLNRTHKLTIKFIDAEGCNHELVIEQQDKHNTTYNLIRRGKGWYDEYRNKSALKLTDDGDGVVISRPGRKPIELDYGEVRDLYRILWAWREQND